MTHVKRALIVGVDDYPEDQLTGCCADAEALSQVLGRHANGEKNFECVTLTSPPSKVTRASLRASLYELFRDPADAVYFHFSGHGTEHSIGGFLVTTDCDPYDPGVAMSEVLALANAAKAREVVITLDCCHSGHLGAIPAVGTERVILADEVSIITATRSDQVAIEEGGKGVFTSLLVEALNGGAAGVLGEVTTAGVYAYIDNALGAWMQRPLFKANVSRFTTLRQSAPRLEREQLRRITRRLPLPAEELQLSPEYEPDSEPHDEEKEACFRDLTDYRYAGLVEPVGEKYMYYAAMKSKSCRLTLLGRYYWRLVNEDRI